MNKIREQRWLITVSAVLILLFSAGCQKDETPTATSTPILLSTPTLVATKTPAPPLTSTLQPPPTPTRTATLVPPVTHCPNAPDLHLKIGDWAMVGLEPPLPNKVRSQPGSSSELVGQIQPGENVLVLAGPTCADGYAWWQVRSLTGLEGWTVEGDTSGYWLVDPISVWHPLPKPLQPLGTQTYPLREFDISVDKALAVNLAGEYLPLATPLPTPMTAQTPYPNDPRGDIDMAVVMHAAQSIYELDGVLSGYLYVFELKDPLSRFYLNRMRNEDCTGALKSALARPEITAANLKPFCGSGTGLPLHFIADIERIKFTGGQGVRFLISSANYLTVNELNYIFEGLSDDGRYFIRGYFRSISHPYIVDATTLQNDFGPLLGWKDGQYDEAQKSYDLFNTRIEKLLEAGLLPLYPSLDFLDEMLASIEIK
jgi:hypothetical protein